MAVVHTLPTAPLSMHIVDVLGRYGSIALCEQRVNSGLEHGALWIILAEAVPVKAKARNRVSVSSRVRAALAKPVSHGLELYMCLVVRSATGSGDTACCGQQENTSNHHGPLPTLHGPSDTFTSMPVALSITYTDSIMKIIATTGSIVLTTVLNAALLSGPSTLPIWTGGRRGRRGSPRGLDGVDSRGHLRVQHYNSDTEAAHKE